MRRDRWSTTPAACLQIGILVGYRALNAADLRLIRAIRRDGRFDVRSLLVLAGDSPAGTHGRGLANLLLSMESRMRGKRENGAERTCEEALRGIETITLAPTTGKATSRAERFRDPFDLILDLDGHEEIPPPLEGAAEFGVWSLHYGDAERLRSPAPGFWEVYLGHGVTGASLLSLAPRRADATIIATGRYPTRQTYLGNLEALRERSVELVLRELGKLHRNRNIPPRAPQAFPVATLPAPNLLHMARYALRPAGILSRQARNNVAGRLGVPTNRWSLFVGRGRYEEASWADCIETRAPAGQYWADPFLFRKAGGAEDHIFFELFDKVAGRGRISVGRIVDGRIAYLGDAVVTDYHLSYPFVFAHDGDIWMVPESHEAKRLELWRCVEFPLGWELVKTVLEGESLADSTLCQWEGHWWLFTNKSIAGTADHNCALHIYRIDSPMMNTLEPHHANPVVIDATRARNGGRIHLRDGFLMRPAQNNAHHYGYGLSVQRIKTLTLEAYEEEQVLSVRPGFIRGISACHHLDTNGETFVFDARRTFG